VGHFEPRVILENRDFIKLDFGQNFAGFIHFRAKGKEGSVVTIRYAEVLDNDGNLYFDNLRSAKATDRLILSEQETIFQPRFTFHGFRYVQIENIGDCEITDIKGIVLSQYINYHGSFECSDPIINNIYKNVLWGQKSNFISIPMDCPQRDERLGWTGDAEIFCNTAMFNSDCRLFFDNYLKLIRTEILPDGRVPIFAPFFIPVNENNAGIPGWADAICLIPYYHYLHYRDEAVIRENIAFAVKHFEFYMSKSKDFLIKTANPFGDWLSVIEKTDVEVINQCFFGLCALLISKMFGILCDSIKEAEYMEYYHKIREAFRVNYLKGNKIISDTQTAYAFSKAVGFVEKDEISRPFIESIMRQGERLTTGFIGVKYVLPSLCEIGETDLAYRIMKQTAYPSWGYTIKNGATTIWERWNGYTEDKGFESPSMNSFNHYCLGSCVEWLYSHVLGLKLSLSGEICISPSFSSELSFARGKYMSSQGIVSVEWRCIDNKFHLIVDADEKVNYSYDFKDRKIISLKRESNRLEAIIK
jgi:alpha-L-rhamnosidase